MRPWLALALVACAHAPPRPLPVLANHEPGHTVAACQRPHRVVVLAQRFEFGERRRITITVHDRSHASVSVRGFNMHVEFPAEGTITCDTIRLYSEWADMLVDLSLRRGSLVTDEERSWTLYY
jgi:hypothetical protein